MLLINPLYPQNVAASLRQAALTGGAIVYYTTERVPSENDWPPGYRLPREERMKVYGRVALVGLPPLNTLLATATLRNGWEGLTAVCVEKRPGAQRLDSYVHPERAIYIFGPEDGSVPPSVRALCRDHVRIPTVAGITETPYNLSHAMTLTLFNRADKLGLLV